LIVHGSDDQIVPIAASALLSSKIVKNNTLKVYDGAPHGLPSTLKDRLNADMLAVRGVASQMSLRIVPAHSRRTFPGRERRRGCGAYIRTRRRRRAACGLTDNPGRGAQMNTFAAKDGTQIYYKDWGTGQPVVFSHGWPLTVDAWEDAMFFLASHGYRVYRSRSPRPRPLRPILGRQRHGHVCRRCRDAHREARSPDVILVGHSTGGGEVARYIGRHGTARVAGAVLVSDITPVMLKSAYESAGDADRRLQWHSRRRARRSSEVLRRSERPVLRCKSRGGRRLARLAQVLRRAVDDGRHARLHLRLKGDSPDSDFTADLKKIDVPTLIVHGRRSARSHRRLSIALLKNRQECDAEGLRGCAARPAVDASVISRSYPIPRPSS
jgi:non-heme chloroperoxidase